MSLARVVAVAPGSPAQEAGVLPGDELVAIAGRPIRDVIEFRVLSDEPEVTLDLLRGGIELALEVAKDDGAPLGLEVDSPVFDEVRTCDNHCEFCFIYQLPPGMRRSLYLKDDDYRLSFLYGNFTTLTRFTEADLERVLVEGLSPLFVSIHATDPAVRSDLLRNRRGGMSLRWLRALLDHGVEVHGQVVVCPGLNDGAVLQDTLWGILDEYPELADVAVVPLGISAFNTEPRMRAHTPEEAAFVVDAVEAAQSVFLAALGRPDGPRRRRVLPAGRPTLPRRRGLRGLHHARGRHRHGPGLRAGVPGRRRRRHRRAARLLLVGRRCPCGRLPGPAGRTGGCGLRCLRRRPGPGRCPAPAPDRPVGTPVALGARADAPVGILTGTYGAAVLEPLVAGLDRDDVRVIPVENRFFGGNIGVTGLMVGEDLARVLAEQPAGHRYLLPDVCLSRGVFLDGTSPSDLPRPVEVVPTDGIALRRSLQVRPHRTGAGHGC